MRGDRSMPMKRSTSLAKAVAASPVPQPRSIGALEERGLACRRAHRQHRLEQQRRTAIAEIVDQRRFEPRRVLIEQRLHIGLRHARHRLCAEPHQIAGWRHGDRRDQLAPRLAKGRDRRIMLAELLADFAEREPGRSKVRREFGGLQQQIGGRGADRPSIAGRGRIRTGGRQSDRRRTGTGARAFGTKIVMRGLVTSIGMARQSIERNFQRWRRGSSPRMTAKHRTAKHRR